MESCKHTQKDLISCMKQMLGQNILGKVMRKLLQCQIQKIISMILTVLKWIELWRRGSVVGSWLLDLTADVFRRDSDLNDSLEGFPTQVRVAGLLMPLSIWVYLLLSSAVHCANVLIRAVSDLFGSKVLNGMRYMFGGHHVR